MWKVKKSIDLGISCTYECERIEDAVKYALEVAYEQDAAELENENVRFYTDNRVSADGDPYPYNGKWNVGMNKTGPEAQSDFKEAYVALFGVKPKKDFMEWVFSDQYLHLAPDTARDDIDE